MYIFVALKPSPCTWQHTMSYQYQATTQGQYLRKGPWHQDEDEQLTSFVARLGDRRWDSLAKVAGLGRSGKSCRLRWMNYLRPNLKHGPFSVEEKQLILQLQQQWGNKWSRIAGRLPGRTDNEIKNYCRSYLRKKTPVQHEGLLNYKLENSADDVLGNKSIDDVVSKDYNHVNFYCQEDKWETRDNSTDTSSLSDWELRSSPYETRILDWIAELQNESDEKELEQDCNSTGAYDYDPERFGECCDTWDYSGSLWNMN